MKAAAKQLMGLFLAALMTATGAYAAPSPVTLTVQDARYDLAGTGFSVDVEVDDAQYILGAAFTVQYDTARLSLTSVESTFFDTFENQFEEAGAYNDPPVSVTVDEVTYTSPLVAGPQSTEAGGNCIAGVCARSAGTGSATLCTLHFEVSDAAYGDSFAITVAPSVIDNETAGYDAAGEQVAMLITQTAEKSFETIEVASIVPGTVSVIDTSETVISGTLTVDGQVVADTEITIYSALTGATVTTTTDENGYFEVTLSGSAAGAALQVSFNSADYGQYTADLTASGGTITAAFTNSAPQQPVLLTITGPTGLTPTFATESFDDANNGHGLTEWQIVNQGKLAQKGLTLDDLLDTDGAIADDTFLVLHLQDSASLTALTVPDYYLDADSAYAVRARFFDDCASGALASAWSDFVSFETEALPQGYALSDGVLVPENQLLNEEELAAFDEGVVGIHSADGGVNLGVALPDNTAMGRLSAIALDDAALAAMPEDLELPYGLVGFNLKLGDDAAGSTTSVSIYFSEAVPEEMTWWKYDAAEQEWIDYTEYSTFADDRKSVELTLVDGGAGDADELVNSRIVDPGGVGTAINMSPSAGDETVVSGGSDSGLCFIGTLLR